MQENKLLLQTYEQHVLFVLYETCQEIGYVDQTYIYVIKIVFYSRDMHETLIGEVRCVDFFYDDLRRAHKQIFNTPLAFLAIYICVFERLPRNCTDTKTGDNKKRKSFWRIGENLFNFYAKCILYIELSK